MSEFYVGEVTSVKRNAALGVSLIVFITLATTPLTSRGSAIDEQTVLTDFAEALTIVDEHYVDKVEYESSVKTAILGMLHTLDPHSNFFDKREYARFRIEQTSQYYGIGATIGPRNGKVYVLAPFENTPAHRAGLRYGDQIIAINGESTDGWPSGQVSERLRGPRGTTVEVQIMRSGEKAPRTIKLTRDAVPLPTITNAYIVRPGIGYISLARGFNTTTADELQQALSKLSSQGATRIVLDLRGNPGGFLEQAIRVADQFLYSGQLVLTQKSRSGRRNAERPYYAQNTSPNLMPLVVLVNRGTASASEIVAASIQEHDRGLIVGESSFGKALVQTIMPLPFGTGLTLSTAKYLTPSGRLIQRNYSNLSFYSYYAGRDNPQPSQPEPPASGPAFRTDTGREVYSGRGITPDISAPPTTLTREQSDMLGAIFAFTRELVAGTVRSLERYRVEGITFVQAVSQNEYRISDDVLDAFKKSALERKDPPRLTAKVIDENREFLRNYIRYEVVSAAHGLETATQVLNDTDLQVLKGIEAFPKATEISDGFKQRTGQKPGAKPSRETQLLKPSATDGRSVIPSEFPSPELRALIG
jgi:carboxyl-terminal processing protease